MEFLHFLAHLRPPLGHSTRLKDDPSPNTPISTLRLIVFDTETTGLNQSKDELLSIGGVVVVGGTIYAGQSFECLLQGQTTARETVAIHGITATDRLQGEHPSSALTNWLKFVQASPLVGLNVAFDRTMVSQATQTHLGHPFVNKAIELKNLVRRADPDVPEAVCGNLEELAKRYGFDFPDRHTAAGDALVTALVLIRTLKLLERRGVKRYGQLRRKPLI